MQVWRIALDQLAPLFIPEEKCLLPILVIKTRDEKGTTDVSAENVVVQFGTSSRGSRRVLVLPAVCIESCVAIELPRLTMETLGAALESETDCRSR